MKIINLPRQFIYTDCRTLDDFLRGDELNKELYKVYLKVKDSPYYFKFDAEKAFNEAYYIATMAMNDPHPELDVREWWFRAKGDIGWAYAANLVMSMVYAILSLQENRPEKIDYVLTIMDGSNYGEEHFPYFKDMAEHEKRRFHSDLTIHPITVDELRNLPIHWPQVTEDFEQEAIKELISLYPTKEEKLKLINLIEQRQNEMLSPNPGFLEPDLDPADLPF
jgi:hypothetical protein